jgi:diguanylate cyclase (GGDEF)-like protein/PAS domain S-box-containing protein
MPHHAAEESAEQEALLQFLYLAPVGLAQTTLEGEIVMINPLSSQLLMPLAQDGFCNLFTALEGVAPDLRHQAASFSAASGMICDSVRIQLAPASFARPDPQTLSLTLLKLNANQLMVVLSDVTEHIKRERLLRQSEAWLHAIVTGVRDYALISLDSRGRVESWNESIGRITGYDSTSIGAPYSIFYPDDGITPDRLIDRLREADESGWSIDDGWRRRANGSRFWGSALISPLRLVKEEAGPAYCLIIRDISDQLEATEKVRRANSCDHLTGIANRRTLFEAAEIELARWKRIPRPLSLVMIDADNFKTINDRFGHPAGDAVLCNLASVLTKTFRECDIVARIGGEEFAVLLPSTNTQGALAVATRLVDLVAAQTLEIDGHGIRYTVSAGVAGMDPDVTGFDALMKRADQALYDAKSAGRNRAQAFG